MRTRNQKVANFHFELLSSVSEIMGAMAISDPDHLHPWHIMRRTSPTEIKHYGQIYEFLNDGDLMKESLPKTYERAVNTASADQFEHVTGQ